MKKVKYEVKAKHHALVTANTNEEAEKEVRKQAALRYYNTTDEYEVAVTEIEDV